MPVNVPLFSYWVFDLDGTLTVPMHDFAAKGKELGIPKGIPMLEAAEQASIHERERILTAVEAWEKELAESAKVAAGAQKLLADLDQHGCQLGILTRNTREIALRTLEVIGLARFFDKGLVLGRGDARAKPDPQGVQKHLRAWNAEPDKAIMVGDYLFDLQAGRAAGAKTLWAKPAGSKDDFSHWADFVVSHLGEVTLQTD